VRLELLKLIPTPWSRRHLLPAACVRDGFRRRTTIAGIVGVRKPAVNSSAKLRLGPLPTAGHRHHVEAAQQQVEALGPDALRQQPLDDDQLGAVRGPMPPGTGAGSSCASARSSSGWPSGRSSVGRSGNPACGRRCRLLSRSALPAVPAMPSAGSSMVAAQAMWASGRMTRASAGRGGREVELAVRAAPAQRGIGERGALGKPDLRRWRG